MSDETKRGTNVCLRINPDNDTKVFRLRAADELLRYLVEAHESEFTMNGLAYATGRRRSTVCQVVEFLDELGYLQVCETTQRKHVTIDPAQLQKDDPILSIEQTEYHDPIGAFIQRVESTASKTDKVEQLLGVLVIGSVAWGEAARRRILFEGIAENLQNLWRNH